MGNYTGMVPHRRPVILMERDAASGTQSRVRHPKRFWVSAAVLLAVLAAAYVASALYTDRPQFCVTCHEMRPYYSAWASGPHKDNWCVDCHVAPGYPARVAHKFAVLGEVVVHFAGKPQFPLRNPPVIPDSRCAACHTSITRKLPKGFDHAVHAKKASCQSCHPSDGHRVTRAALGLEGVLDPTVVRPSASASMAVVGEGVANVAGHISVMCTNCHDLRKTGCKRCHSAPATKHPRSPECVSCHGAGPKWVFTHPGLTQDCKACHSLPTKHFRPASASLEPCSACHTKPGASWAFQHPRPNANCQSCHKPPAKHFTGQCSTCHKNAGVSFAFRHPHTDAPHGISGRACAKCHPNGYATATCTCHDGKGGED
jgi:trimethylamine-N-oxide reductase cytochrome c-type subunit TorC